MLPGSSNDAASSEGGDSPPRDVEFEAALHVQAEDESATREKLFSTAHPSLEHAVAALNAFLRKRGYQRSLEQEAIRQRLLQVRKREERLLFSFVLSRAPQHGSVVDAQGDGAHDNLQPGVRVGA